MQRYEKFKVLPNYIAKKARKKARCIFSAQYGRFCGHLVNCQLSLTFCVYTKLLGDAPITVGVLREEKTRKPYPLSKWDNIIIDVIKENGRPTTSKEIYDSAMQKAKEQGIAMGEDKMKAKINQCLVKLTNRRHDLKKVKYKGRGFAYSI